MSADTNALIVSSVIVTVGSSFIAAASQGKGPTFNTVLGGGFMGAFLFGIQLIDDELARLFAILVIIGVLLRNGDKVFSFFGNASTAKNTAGLTTPSTIKNA